MIDVYFAPTPNGWKASVMLEECGLDYNVNWVDIGAGDQFEPDFLAISPNNRIPALVDHRPIGGGEPLALFETGAILIYLAEKTGKFLPADLAARYGAIKWLMWQIGGLGPMLGQHGHFALYAPEQIPYAIERYRREALRLYGVLDRQLAENEHVAGADYTIADIACFPWIQTYRRQQIELADFPHVGRWYETLKARPALRRGMAIGRDRIERNPQDDEKAARILFGIGAKE